MTVLVGRLGRYFGLRFLGTVLGVFFAMFAMVALLDYIELMRRAADEPRASALLVLQASFFRVPQVTERIMSFCVLIGAMACYLGLSRRLELVVARAAGMSAWQFIAPAVVIAFLLGVIATTIYNPISATLQERSKRIEAEIFNQVPTGRASGGVFWIGQRTGDGQAIINAKTSRNQGVELGGVTIFTFNPAGKFLERIEAANATLEPGVWRLSGVRVNVPGSPATEQKSYEIRTNLTPAQVRESFATPETVPFWLLPQYIDLADSAGLVAAGYKLQYQKLLARPFLLVAMVFLAAAVSLRFFRFGGVQKMVLYGVAAGFLLYVFSKITEDFSKAELMHPAAAAWLPVLLGGFAGLVTLLYQEDG
jgi:lipopolysaccharide export system permease protein